MAQKQAKDHGIHPRDFGKYFYLKIRLGFYKEDRLNVAF